MQPYAAKGQKTLTDMICAKQKRKEGDGLPRSSALRGHRLGACVKGHVVVYAGACATATALQVYDHGTRVIKGRGLSQDV
eukprot:1153150-Pelagomonas_calceolata.AAC.6